MNIPIMFNGIVNGATYILDDTTVATVADDPKKIEGLVVTVTESGKVGFGSAGDNPRGFVQKFEYQKSGSQERVVSVIWNKEFTGIPCSGSESVKNWVACDGKGGVQPSTTATSARIDEIDTVNNVCTVYIHG